MKAELLEHLAAAALDVLKTSAYACGEPCPAVDLPVAVDELLLARVHFDGESSGDVYLAMPHALAASLAADVLAADVDELSHEQIIDACKELTNVLCGQWLTRSFGTRPVFRLSVPEAVCQAPRFWTSFLATPSAIGIQIDDQPLAACVQMQAEATS